MCASGRPHLARRRRSDAQGGRATLPVDVVATELGMSWWTGMGPVRTPPARSGPARVGYLGALGVDETSFVSPTRYHHAIYAGHG